MPAPGSRSGLAGQMTLRSRSRRQPASMTATGRGSNVDPPTFRQAAQVPGYFIERTLGGRKTDPDEARGIDRLQALQQQGQEDAPLVAADRMDLVDDHMRDHAEGLSCPAGEHQVERLRRRDEDIRRLADHPGPLLARRVATADGDAQRGQGRPHLLRPGQDSFERELEVAPDVLIQGLERRNVEDPDPLLFPRGPPEVVECRQEGRERLARSGRRDDQGILPGSDHRPAEPLGRRGLAELLPKPRRHRRMELVEGILFVFDSSLHGCRDSSQHLIRVVHDSHRFSPRDGSLASLFLYRSLLGRKKMPFSKKYRVGGRLSALL